MYLEAGWKKELPVLENIADIKEHWSEVWNKTKKFKHLEIPQSTLWPEQTSPGESSLA